MKTINSTKKYFGVKAASIIAISYIIIDIASCRPYERHVASNAHLNPDSGVLVPTPTVRVVPVTSPVITITARPPPDDPWSYSSSSDEMRGSRTSIACIDSTNSFEFGFPYSGGTRGSLCLRYSTNNGPEILVFARRGQISCYDCRIGVRFDAHIVNNYSPNRSNDGQTLFLPRAFLTNLRGSPLADRVIIEIPFYRDGVKQFIFSGLSSINWARLTDGMVR